MVFTVWKNVLECPKYEWNVFIGQSRHVSANIDAIFIITSYISNAYFHSFLD